MDSIIRMADTAGRHRRVAAAVEEGVLSVLRSGRYIGGPVVAEAQRRIAEVFGWRHGVGVNSGTDALVYALQALGIQPGDEVIVPALTFFATAEAVGRIGAVPVVADVRSDLPLLDAERLPIGAKTRLVIAVHLYGEHCVLPTLPVPVLDDSAQCIGASPPARTGVMAACSFYPTKTLGAAGDGGMVFTDDPQMAECLVRLTHHAMPEPNLHERINGHFGGNSRLDAIQAAVLLAHLDDLPARLERRRRYAAMYDEALPDAIRRLPRSPGHPVHQYVVRAPARDALRAHLSKNGVETALYYPRSLAAQPALSGQAATPEADAFCAEAVALPVHEVLEAEQVETVIASIQSFYQ